MQFHIFIIELQYQYLDYITGIPVLYKILRKKSQYWNTFLYQYCDRQVQAIQALISYNSKKIILIRLNENVVTVF